MGKRKPDRDFMIAFRQQWSAADLNAGTAKRINLSDAIPPIDVWINAIHQIVQLTQVPDTEFAMMSTTQAPFTQGTMTYDGQDNISQLLASLVAEEMLHYMHPNEVHYDLHYFNSNSILGDTRFTSEFFEYMAFYAENAGSQVWRPDKFGSDVTLGTMQTITLIEVHVQ